MIRRDINSQWWLITQQEHARISGLLAREIGNNAFSKLSDLAIQACAAHDEGWATHDDKPTLNSGAMPLDVFETPRSLSFDIWEASARRASEIDPYVGLLVSLHSFWLSLNPVDPASSHDTTRTRFETNRFQHSLIELQETLRLKCNLRIDRALKYGLAPASRDPTERRLGHDFAWLRALDLLSLVLCCTNPPAHEIDVPPKLGQAPVKIVVERSNAFRVHLAPWPFAKGVFELNVQYRAFKPTVFETADEFRALYFAAAIQSFTVELMPFNIGVA